jgi:hypothetical protein
MFEKALFVPGTVNLPTQVVTLEIWRFMVPSQSK